MNTIPQYLIDKHKQGVEKLMFYGVSVTELDRDGLLAFANLCAQELTGMRQRVFGIIETSRSIWAEDVIQARIDRDRDKPETRLGAALVDVDEMPRLLAIEAAAKKFDEAGTTANQMNPEQWQAYLELKALFHGGIKE